MNNDLKHLELLSVFHFIIGGLGILLSFFPLIHVIIGWNIAFNPKMVDGDFPSQAFGWIFVILGFIFILVGLTLSICIIYSGTRLAKQRGYWFSFIIACIECAFFPLGSALGVFTIIILTKDSVKQLYGIEKKS